MAKFQDLTGETFGRLTVLSLGERQGKRRDIARSYCGTTLCQILKGAGQRRR